MGVFNLWPAIQPSARPTKLSSLTDKRLAIDASIWVYQFVKAMRTPSGEPIRAGHVIGFFRRLCKLLFLGIRPVFVFDGVVPELKRKTILARRRRREGRREDARRVAGKLLITQLHRARSSPKVQAEAPATPPSKEQSKPSSGRLGNILNGSGGHKDQFHLPEISAPIATMGGADDPRIMSLDELERYAKEFSGDVDVYDLSQIDFDSQLFKSLPVPDQYRIISAARLRSRLRMGLSKDQLDGLFPDRMAFSKFQIERVKERNELTQRLMVLMGMTDSETYSKVTGRIASERGREYVLVRNNTVEGGWALGVVGSGGKGGLESKPINIADESGTDKQSSDSQSESDDSDEFEDVPIESLNRLPKKLFISPSGKNAWQQKELIEKLSEQRQRLYKLQSNSVERKNSSASFHSFDNLPRIDFSLNQDASSDFGDASDNDELFVRDDKVVDRSQRYSSPFEIGDTDEADMQQAIERSLNQVEKPLKEDTEEGESESKRVQLIADDSDDDDDDFKEVFRANKAEWGGSVKREEEVDFARLANQRSASSVEQFLPKETHKAEDPKPDVDAAAPEGEPRNEIVTKEAEQDGLLPFRSLKLGTSFLKPKRSASPEKPTDPLMAGQSEANHLEPSTKDAKVEVDPELESDFDLNGPGGGFIARGSAEAGYERAVRRAKLVEKRSNSIKEIADQIRLEHSLSKSPELEKEKDGPLSLSSPKPMRASWTPTRAGVKDESNQSIFRTPSRSASVAGQSPVLKAESPKSVLKTTRFDSPRPSSLKVSFVPGEKEEEEPIAQKNEEPSVDPAADTADPATQVNPATPATPDQPKAPSPSQAASADNDNIDNQAYGIEDESDTELAELLAAETREHARFAAELGGAGRAQSGDTLPSIEESTRQLAAALRDSDEVSSTVIAECQHLLSLFGIPYVTAPSEAEAQCAELLRLGLVDGVVTDDSDVLLFGADRVYRHMFSQEKFVECFQSADLVAEYGLERRRLIEMALLLGSDYTEGLYGIGPVTGLEIVSEFASLGDFASWWAEAQVKQINSPKAASTTSRDGDGDGPADDPEPASSLFSSAFKRRFHKTHATKLFLPPNFPDRAVIGAYLHPTVDSDPSPFTWGLPDLARIREYLGATAGWPEERTDELLVPVVQLMNKRAVEGRQTGIEQYLEPVAPNKRQRSKRVESALGKMREQKRRKKEAN